MKKIIISALVSLIMSQQIFSAETDNDIICSGLGSELKKEQKALDIFSMGNDFTNEEKKFTLTTIAKIKQILRLMPKYCSVFKDNPEKTTEHVNKLLKDLENKRSKVLN